MLKPGSYFTEQTRDEKVVMFVRRHWLSFLNWVIILIIMFFIPPITFYSNRLDLINTLKSSYTSLGYFVIITACYYLFVLALFLTSWMNYYLDVTIVTSNHLVDIRQFGLFNRRVAEQSLMRVQDVSSRMKGFLQTLARYGTVYVETAADSPNFEMNNIPRPYKVANTIMELHEEMVKSGKYSAELAEGEGEYQKKLESGSKTTKTEGKTPPRLEVLSMSKKTIPAKTNEVIRQSQKRLIDLQDNSQKNLKVAVNSEKDDTPKNSSTNTKTQDRNTLEGELKDGETVDL